MNTSYPFGQHVFFDSDAGNDNICAVASTSLSGHLVGIFTAVRALGFTTVYGQVITADGVMPPPFTVPDNTDRNQKDASIATIDGTDDFVVAWTSSATDNYVVYLRRFRVNPNGSVIPVSLTQQVSENHGDYMAPRVVWLPEHQAFFMLWLAVRNREVQCKYLSYNDSEGTFDDISYTTTLNDSVHHDYFSSDIDISSDANLSICLITTPDRIIAGLKRSHNEVGLYEFMPPAPGEVQQHNLPVYSVEDLSKFDICYDPEGLIKIVYVKTGISPVYGDNIPLFGRTQVAGAPVRLNQLFLSCGRPVIRYSFSIAPPAATAPQVSAASPEARKYHVCWDTSEHGCVYNRFNDDFFAAGPEDYINSSDGSSNNPRLLLTDNQNVVVFHAAKLDELHLGDNAGILFNVHYR